MQRKQIPIEEIEPTYGYNYHNEDLVKRVREFGWEGIPPVPVIKIPEDLRRNGKKYSNCDGHHRHNVAIETSKSNLDCLVYGSNDNLKTISEQTGRGLLMDYQVHLDRLRRSCG